MHEQEAELGERAPAVLQQVHAVMDANVLAGVLTAFVVGRLQRFARSGFKRSPGENLEHSLALLLPIGRL